MQGSARVNTLASTQPPSTSDSLTGTCEGPWRIEYELGRGGMGVVYAVVHVHIGKRAALKVLHRRIPDPERHAQRMLLEARVVNAIGHPNIVDVFDVGTTRDGRPYIVMERLEGTPLSDLFISRRCAIEIMIEVCAALTAAHDAGVVHRDLKPDNVFVGDQAVTLLDWGIARMLHADPGVTIEGQVIGTPQYLSPEQARGEDVTLASDVYALGVVAYELFVGEAPFEAVTAAEVMAMHIYMPPKPPEITDHVARVADPRHARERAEVIDRRFARSRAGSKHAWHRNQRHSQHILRRRRTCSRSRVGVRGRCMPVRLLSRAARSHSCCATHARSCIDRSTKSVAAATAPAKPPPIDGPECVTPRRAAPRRSLRRHVQRCDEASCRRRLRIRRRRRQTLRVLQARWHARNALGHRGRQDDRCPTGQSGLGTRQRRSALGDEARRLLLLVLHGLDH